MNVPPFFAIVLIKTLWMGGAVDNSDQQKWLSPPQAYTTSVVEPSLEKCKADGAKWETDFIQVILSGKDQLDIDNGVWKCEVMLTGGLLT